MLERGSFIVGGILNSSGKGNDKFPFFEQELKHEILDVHQRNGENNASANGRLADEQFQCSSKSTIDHIENEKLPKFGKSEKNYNDSCQNIGDIVNRLEANVSTCCNLSFDSNGVCLNAPQSGSLYWMGRRQPAVLSNLHAFYLGGQMRATFTLTDGLFLKKMSPMPGTRVVFVGASGSLRVQGMVISPLDLSSLQDEDRKD